MDGLAEETKKDLLHVIKEEEAQARVQSSIQTFTSMCWDKCITGTPSTRFSRGEEACLANCVERFLDSSIHIVRQIEQSRPQ